MARPSKIEISDNNRRTTCSMCGKSYATKRNNFAKSYSVLSKGIGYMSICKDCLDRIYTEYLDACNDPVLAVRQTCRKLDLYWSETLFEQAFAKSTVRQVIHRYCTLLTGHSYAGMCYDDTLIGEGRLWELTPKPATSLPSPEDESGEGYSDEDGSEESERLTLSDIDQEVIEAWGIGYTPEMYRDLEQRRKFWLKKLPKDVELDIGTEALIRQICSLELDINRDRAAGRSVEKSVTALNTLLGSANLKPVQKKDTNDSTLENTPLGVWLYKYENKRPLPNDEYEDSKLLKYLFTWMGHVLVMLGVKNSPYAQMYQAEIDRLRVERPEYDGDDEELFMDYLNGGDDDA